MSAWYVYLLECRDGSVYTGIAVDVDRRYAQHVAGKGARYTRSHPPVRLLGWFAHEDRSAASRAEHAIKQLTPARKRALFQAGAPPRGTGGVSASAEDGDQFGHRNRAAIGQRKRDPGHQGQAEHAAEKAFEELQSDGLGVHG
jgi:putative endonuclease